MGERTTIPLIPAFLFLLGCAVPEPAKPEAPRRERRPASRTFAYGRSVEGRPLLATEHGAGREVVLVLGGIHGDEEGSRAFVEALGHLLRDRPGLLAGRQVLLVPAANPDGLARRTRANARGVDLNRNFPTSNFRPGGPGGTSPFSEPESRALGDLIVARQPALVVSVHQPLACVDWDGPARGAAERISEASGLPLRKLGARPGSLGSFVGLTLGRPIVTLELGKDPPDPECVLVRP